MSCRIEYSKKAINDLDDLFNYMLIESLDKIGVERFFNKLFETIDLLTDFPYSGKQLILARNIKTNYRYLIYKKYFLFYTVDDDVVKIERVIHSKRDYIHCLLNDSQIGGK